MKQLSTIAKWINSCNTYEQVMNLEEFIERNYLRVPLCLEITLSNKKTLLACNL